MTIEYCKEMIKELLTYWNSAWPMDRDEYMRKIEGYKKTIKVLETNKL